MTEEIVQGDPCPECGWQYTTFDVVGGETYIVCPNCPFIQDTGGRPSYDSEMGQGGAAYNDVMFGDGGE